MLEAQIIGNLGSDAEVRKTNSGRFVSFRVAHSDSFLDESGTRVQVTTWVSVTLNGDGGKLLQYLRKGTKVYVSGRLSTRVYKGNDGQYRAGLSIGANRIELCGSSQDNQHGNAPSAPNQTKVEDSDIPF